MVPKTAGEETPGHHCAAITVAACLALAAGPGVAAEPALADLDITELVMVRVSPFDVASHLDRGYRASNSVSGSRFDTPIRELPFAIQAFTENFIADLRPRDIHDVARYSPGVTYRSNDFNEGNANLAIRGFAVSAVPGGVQILRDGFHGPPIMDFTNIARVEVLKGPSSFLYGQVAPGGIVNVITKSPQPRLGARAELAAGSYGQYRAELDLGGRLAPALFYRLAASHDQDIGYWKPYDAHSRGFAPSLLWQPDERLSLALKYEHFRKRESPQVMQKPGYGRQSGIVPTADDPNRQGVDVPGLPDDWNSMSEVDYRNSDTEGLSAWLDWRAGAHWNLRTGAAHQTDNIDALFSGNLGMSNNETFLQGRRLRRQTYASRDDTISVDAVGRYRFDAFSLRLLLGAQQVRRQFDNRAGQAPNDPALGSDPIASPLPLWDLRDPSTWNREVDIALDTLTENPADRRSTHLDRSVYAGSTFGLLDERLLLLAGWRLTATDTRLRDRVADSRVRITARKGTPQLGLLYKLSPQLSAFASYAESFVPGTQVLRRLDGSTAPAAPSRGQGWDLGLKGEWLGGRASGTLTLFDLRNRDIVNDIARTDASGAVVISNLQSGEQRSRGLEIDATLAPAERWQLYLSYGYMDARIVEVTGDDAALLARDPATLDEAGRLNYKNVRLLHDARLQMSAPHLANVWARHDFPAGASGQAWVAGGLNLVHDQTLLPDGPASSRQSYTLVNAQAGWAWRHGERRTSLELVGRNLGGARYRPSQSTRARPREVLLVFRVAL